MPKKGKIEPRKEKVPYLGQYSINFGLKLINKTFYIKKCCMKFKLSNGSWKYRNFSIFRMSKKGKIEPRKEKVPYLGQYSINLAHFGLKLINETSYI